MQGSHPVPDQQSIQATQALMEITRDCTKEDLIFCLISGGGSALFTNPVEGITLEDMQALTRQLLKSGAEIGEINTLRKHLDRVKGGGLSRWLFPAQVVTLIISDVIGSPLEVIASGPTVADPSTFADAVQILHKYHLNDEIPGSIGNYFQRGLIDASLERDMSDIGLRSLHIHVEYKPAEVGNKVSTFDLPALAVVDVTTPRQHWRNTHVFDAYKSFSIDVEQDPNVKIRAAEGVSDNGDSATIRPLTSKEKP